MTSEFLLYLAIGVPALGIVILAILFLFFLATKINPGAPGDALVGIIAIAVLATVTALILGKVIYQYSGLF